MGNAVKGLQTMVVVGWGYESLYKKHPLLLFGLVVAGMDGMALSV